MVDNDFHLNVQPSRHAPPNYLNLFLLLYNNNNSNNEIGWI